MKQSYNPDMQICRFCRPPPPPPKIKEIALETWVQRRTQARTQCQERNEYTARLLLRLASEEELMPESRLQVFPSSNHKQANPGQQEKEEEDVAAEMPPRGKGAHLGDRRFRFGCCCLFCLVQNRELNTEFESPKQVL